MDEGSSKGGYQVDELTLGIPCFRETPNTGTARGEWACSTDTGIEGLSE